MSVAVVPTSPNELLAAMRRAVYLHPAELLDNPRNLRKDVGDVEDLKTSIREVGILCPLIVIPAEDGQRFQLIIGHRRKKAALDLGLAEVPCWIAENEDAAMQILAQLAENGDRVGLTPSEEAEAYLQLTLLDWTPERIASARGVTAKQVAQSLTLGQLPTDVREAADNGRLTLDDAARLEEFADEPAALARILKSASSGWGMRHAMSAERDKKTYASAREQLKARLVLDGVKVTAKPKGYPYDGPARSATSLADSDNNRLDPEVAKTLPGFAVFIEKNGVAANPVVYCTDPDKYGYQQCKMFTGPAGMSPGEQARREVEASARAEYLAALTRAEEVRREFYQATYGTAKAAKKLFVEALRAFASDADLPLYADPDALYTALGGADDDVLASAGEDRLRRALVARWVCAQETNLAVASRDHTWDLNTDAACWWLDQLVADGYSLSDAEATLRASAAGETEVEVAGDDGTEAADDDRLDDLELVLEAEPVLS
ncbi:ParB/RepB/Spo0J family partition protein [Longispora sp. NPDC051575]|uniref:ParB/RepB/Spo0J family partition protein n=1 Tax=Longispora sp. NPDC051575 TaxID=3154943 RepID=UPI0034193FA1